MVLTLGFIVICMLAVAIIVDASSVFIQRRALQSAVDSAALAGAQAIDLEEYYARGAADGVRLDPAGVERAVRRQISRVDEVRLESVRIDDGEVVVRAHSRVRPPFSGWLTPAGSHVIVAEAGATLSYRTSG